MIGALVLVLAVAVALRYGTNVLDKGPVFDEGFILIPIENLLKLGWSVETAIDFKETKGPAFVWAYALAGAVLGPDLNGLRLVSVGFFVLGVVPLLLICRACARTGTAAGDRLSGPGLLLVAGLYALLPHNAVLGQLLMSEPSFVFGALWLMWAFVWGFGTSRGDQHAILGPVIFAVILAVLLHHRVHAAAFGAAAALTALQRDRWRSWPWWLACAVAGLARVPLWIRWGGLVAPEYQSMHGLGFNPDSLTYLAAAVVPLAVLFLWPALTGADSLPRRRLIWVGAGAGLALVLVAMPALSDTLPFGRQEIPRFLGVIATTLRTATDSSTLQALLLGGLTVLGVASMGALAAIGFQYGTGDRLGVVWRLALWTLVAGSALYALTRALVFDRYLLPWAVLLPIAWTAALPRKLLVVQALILVVIFARHAWNLLL
ncbi:MAG: hypothetical protein ACYSWT_13435 [Planctomycetota bacterium]|jgi:hypothetical protein